MGGLGLRLAVMMLMALLPLGLLSLAQTRSALSQAEEGQRLAAMAETLRTAAPDLQRIRDAQAAVEFLSQATEALLRDPAQCRALLRDLASSHPLWDVISYIPPSGIVECSSTGERNDLSRDVVADRILRSKKPQVFTTRRPENLSDSILIVSHPARVGTRDLGQFSVVLRHAPRELPQINIDLFPGLKALISLTSFDQTGTILTSTLGHEKANSALPKDLSLLRLVAQGEQSFFAYDNDDQRRLFTVISLPGQIYLLGTWHIESISFANFSWLNPYVAPILMFLFGLGAAIYGAQRLVVRHLRKLAFAMRSFTFGKRALDDLKLDDPPLEIAYLADAYRTMTETILHDEAELENLVRQKEELLREVHHRTGNSLQLIASIMRMHRRETSDPEIHALLDNLYDRVMSLSTVHLGLYRISGLSEVSVDQLLGEVISKIDAVYARKGQKGRLETALQPITLTAQQAVPLALLLAEVLANADLDNHNQPLTVRLEAQDQGHAHMILSLPPSLRDLLQGQREGAAAQISSRLIRSFTQQLEGEMKLREVSDGNGGTQALVMSVSFKIKH